MAGEMVAVFAFMELLKRVSAATSGDTGPLDVPTSIDATGRTLEFFLFTSTPMP